MVSRVQQLDNSSKNNALSAIYVYHIPKMRNFIHAEDYFICGDMESE